MSKRWIAAFDLHGDMQNREVVEKLFSHIKAWKPHILVMGGDAFDFRCLRKGANSEERSDSLMQDWREGMDFLKRFFAVRNAEKVFLNGNHDQRIYDVASSPTIDGIVRDAAQKGVNELEDSFSKWGVRQFPYHKRHGIYQNGHLKIIHGFWSGMHANKQAALCYGSVLQGHNHTIDEHPIPGIERRVARTCGCLCKVDMTYNERTPSTLRHANGWAYGILNDDGTYQAYQAESVNGKFNVATNITEI